MKKIQISILLTILTGQLIFAQTADMVLTHGKIFTSDSRQLYVEALAIKGNKIFDVGSNLEIKKRIGPKTKVIDLKGKTVVPGFNDGHDHLGFDVPMTNFFATNYSVPGSDRKEIIKLLSEILTKVKPNQWIGGKIGLNALHNPGMRNTLDSLAPANPVALQIWWGHGMVLNSKALRMAGINEDEQDPLGGWYGRRPGSTNLVNGVLYGYAQWPVWPLIYTPYRQELLKQVREICNQQISMGITTVQNFSSLMSPEETSRFFVEAKLFPRIRIIPFPGTTANSRQFSAWTKLVKHPAPKVSVSGVKYLVDGTPFEQAALQTRPYYGNWYGRLHMPVDTIREILKEAFYGDTQLMLHIVGDSSMSIVLKLMKETGTDVVWQKKRVRFEHNQSAGATSKDIQAIKDLGIIMAHTPMYGHNSHLASFLEQGIIVSVSPDGTVNPFADMMIMVSQQANPKENISIEQAVIAYTKTNAYAEFEENSKGTLMPGMVADLAVLSQDIFSIPASQLPQTKSVITLVDGKVVYELPSQHD